MGLLTADEFLDAEDTKVSADAFLDAPDEPPKMSADDFLDAPEKPAQPKVVKGEFLQGPAAPGTRMPSHPLSPEEVKLKQKAKLLNASLPDFLAANSPEDVAALDAMGNVRSGIDAAGAAGISPGSIDVKGVLTGPSVYDLVSGDTTMKEAADAFRKPLVTVPKPTADGVVPGIARGVATLGEGLTTPENIALLATMEGAPAALKQAAGAGFAAMMAKELPGQFQRVGEAQTAGDKAQAITELVGSAAMTVLAAKDAVGGRSPIGEAERTTSMDQARFKMAERLAEADAPLTAAETIRQGVSNEEQSSPAIRNETANDPAAQLPATDANEAVPAGTETRSSGADETGGQPLQVVKEEAASQTSAPEASKSLSPSEKTPQPTTEPSSSDTSAQATEADSATSNLGESLTSEPKQEKLDAPEGYVGGPGAMGPVEGAEMAAGDKPTGLKRSIVDVERLSRGAEPIPTPERQREEALVQAAEDKVDSDPTAAPSLVSKIVDSGERAITEQDAATLLVERRRVMNERAAWEEKIGRGEDVETGKTRLSEIEGELDRLDRAQRSAGSTWGRVGHMYQRLMREDFTLEGMERKARASLERPLTEPERAKIAEQAKKIEELQAKAEAAKTAEESSRQDTEVERIYEATINELGKDYLAKPSYGKQVFDIARNIVDRWKSEADSARTDLRKALGLQLAGIPNPVVVLHVAKILRAKIGEFGLNRARATAEMIAEFGEKIKPHLNAAWTKAQQMIGSEKTEQKVKEVTRKGIKKAGEASPGDIVARAKAEATAGEELSHKTVYELARAHINNGVHGEGPVMAAVFADLKPLYEGLTERDVRRAYSEYGKVKFPSQEATAKELSELRALTRMQESIDRMTEGRDALHTGLQREKATQAIREKQKQMNELLKTRKGPPSQEKLASREEAKQTALKNAIDDLDKQLRTGEKPVASEPAPDSIQTEQLKAERDAMKAKLKEIEEAANPGKSDAEKQIEQLSKVKERLDETLSGKRPENAPKDFEPLSAAAEDIKAEILAMQELAAQLKRDAKPPGDPGARVEQARIKALEESIKRYEEKTAAGDFSTKGKKLGPDSQRVAELKAIRDARIDAYNAAKKAGKPVRSREEIYNATRMKAVEKQIADLQARINAGDFTRKSKPVPPEKTKATKDLEFALSKEKEAFNRGLFEADLAKRSGPKKAWDFTRDVLNTARAAMTSLDLSAVFRQGGFITLGHPVRALKAFPAMFKALMSEQGQFEANREIQSRPNAELYKSSKLHLSDPQDYKLSKLEEAYMTRWAAKIPGISHSERAYTTFLNRIRADSFDAMAESVAGGRKLTPEEGKAIANFVNVATGRGNLAAAAGEAINLNTAFFAPRYVVSRFELLAGQPLYHGTAGTRIAVAKEYARFLAGIGTLYALSQLAGGTVEKDPRSSDFGKIKFGDTRVDPLAGLSQSTVIASRLFTGETKTANGVKSIRGDKLKFGEPDSADVAGRFLRTKLSPIVGSAIDLSSGKDVSGNPVTPGSALTRLAIPLSFSDIYNAMKDQGIPKGTALSLLSFFGMGVQTYGKKSPPDNGGNK